MNSDNAKANSLDILRHLETKARHIKEINALSFFIVNQLIKLAPFLQCFMWKKTTTGFKVIRASAVSQLNRDAPIIRCIEKNILKHITEKEPYQPVSLTHEELSTWLVDEDITIPKILEFIPFFDEDDCYYGLLLFLDTPWKETHRHVINLAIDTFSHAWYALNARKHQTGKRITSKMRLILIIIAVAMFIPIRQSVLAPAEISADQPLVISPGIEGTVKRIWVEPNQHVKKGQLLVTLDDAKLNNFYEQSVKKQQIQQEKLRRAHQHAYLSEKSKAQILILQQEINKNKNTVDYASSLLKRTRIVAPTDGIVIFSDKQYWLGKPIKIGERIMLLAKPNKKKLSIHIPLDDLINMPKKTLVVFYPYPSPLSSISAHMRYISRVPEQQDSNLSYYAIADFIHVPATQIGIKGVAKIYGHWVVLGYYLYRRPISFLRRHL